MVKQAKLRVLDASGKAGRRREPRLFRQPDHKPAAVEAAQRKPGTAPSPSRSLAGALLTLAALLIAGAFALALYLPSLNYGFMLDDPIDLPRAVGRSLVDIFVTPGNWAYHRPLPLAVWKLVYALLGRNDAPALHGIVVGLHVANVWLIYALGSRFYGRIGGFAAALLFAAFPLGYQAVFYANALFHPLVTACLLAATICYLRWREDGGLAWLVAAVVASLLGTLTHESAVMVGALVAGAELAVLAERRKPRPSPAVGLFIAVSAGYFLVWRSLPKWEHSWQPDVDSLWRNALYFFQALVYPVSQRLGGVPDADVESVLLRAGAVALVGIALAHVASRRLAAFAFALTWAVAAVLPSVVSLSYFSYVSGSPRLTYVGAVGTCLLWAGAFVAPFTLRVRAWRILSAPVGIAAFALTLNQSVDFIREYDPLFVAGAKVVAGVVATATDADRPGRVYVNAPAWFALSRDREFPYGGNGVTMLPSYIGLNGSAELQTDQPVDILSLRRDDLAANWSVPYAPHAGEVSEPELRAALARGGGVYFADEVNGEPAFGYAGGVYANHLADPLTVQADFGGWLSLIDSLTLLRPDPDGAFIDVTLNWQLASEPTAEYTVFLHAYDSTGRLVAQADGDPIRHIYPLAWWQPGNRVEDHRRIAFPVWAKPDTYRVVVGVYRRDTGERGVATDRAGARFRDDGVTIGGVDLVDVPYPRRWPLASGGSSHQAPR